MYSLGDRLLVIKGLRKGIICEVVSKEEYGTIIDQECSKIAVKVLKSNWKLIKVNSIILIDKENCILAKD